jgi:DNA-binding CsgD family transcriptional regulator
MESHLSFDELKKKAKGMWQNKSWQLSSNFETEILEIVPQLESILKLHGQYIHIYDLATLDSIYVSKSTETVLGYALDIWKSKTANFALELFCTDEIRALEILSKHLLVHAHQQPRSIHKYFRYSNTLRMRHKNGNYIWILNHLFFLASTEDGIPQIAMSYATDITHVKNNDDIVYFISKYNSSENRYEMQEIKIYKANGSELLSDKEKEVLCYLSEGLSNEEIASRMSLSVHTVRDHRKNMLRKTDVENTCQLLSFALNHSLL